MRKLLFCLAIAAGFAYALGAFVGIVLSGAPGDWLTVQGPTGRPPRIAALLALGPIALIGIVVLVIRLRRRWRETLAQRDANEHR
jgi:hypothetical protein